MESNAFAALAHLKILIVPVGNISKPNYDKWMGVIHTFESIPLVDIPPARYEDKTRFMPNTASTGHLHLHYVSHPPPIWHHTLALFRPSLFPLGIIGIATCTASTSLPSLSMEFNRKVKQLYPYNSPYPLARCCFAFEQGSGEHTQLNVGSDALEVIPSVLGNKTTSHIGMLLAGFCSQILSNFSSLTRMLDTPRGWEVLHSSIFPTYPLEPDEDPPIPKLVVDSPRNSLDSKHASLPSRQSSPSNLPARSSTLSSKVTKRQSAIHGTSPPNGRLSKLLGDFYLLAGRYNDAGNWYNDALNHFKSSPDSIWHAAILEGLCTIAVLEAWAGSAGLQTSLSSNNLRDPWSEISDKISTAINMYSKPPTTLDPSDYSTLTLLYTSAILRYTHFMFSIWASNGWGPMAFLTMLTPSLPPSFNPPPTDSRRWRMTSMTTITRTSIANILSQAHGPWIMHLQPIDRINLLSAMAGFYSCLGFGRKEVYVLRELVSVLMDLLVLAREEKIEQNAAKFGTNDANLSEIASLASGAVSVREQHTTEGNHSILQLLVYICGIYGVDLKSVRLFDGNEKEKDQGKGEENASRKEEFESIDFAKLPVYGWSELQLGAVREALAVAEALPELPSLAQFSLSSLRNLYLHLTASEQYSLYVAAKNAIQVSQRRGEAVDLEYWSARPVVSVEIVSLPFTRIPVEHSKTELVPRSTMLSPTSGPRDPFIYNPRLRSSAASQTLLVQNEEIEFILTLQNPFLFDLELSNVSLSTSGVPFTTQPIMITIPPNSFCPVRLSGIPTQPGSLTIRGCHAQTVGSSVQEFLLPLSTEEEEQKMEKRRSMREAEMDRMKFTGLDARPEKRLSLMPVVKGLERRTKFIECRVTPELPFLRIRRTSLTHGAVMMYNGESTTIRITVENVSSLPIDFLRLTFDDSTIAPMQQALNEGNLSIAETYETEYDLLRRPVFQWKAKDEPKEIKPGQKAVLTVHCLGKVGCVSGTVQIAYGHARREDMSDSFYTRQILYPVLVTVNHTLECYSMDILPFSQVVTLPVDDEGYDIDEKSRRSLLDVDSDSDWCLFTVDVMNAYTLPFEVHFERKQEGTKPITCSRLVPPGSTSRIALPLKRIFLPDSHISRPIPTLSDRQFIVSKDTPAGVDQMVHRELFWYREELFRSIAAWWKEPGGTRRGELSLRRQRLTGPMMEALKTDPIRVELALIRQEEDGTEDPIPSFNGKIYTQPTQFHTLRCCAYNATTDSKILVLSLAANPLDFFHVEGNLTDIPIGRVGSKASKEVDIPICFIAEGQFEFVAEVRVLGEQIRTGEGELKVIVREL